MYKHSRLSGLAENAVEQMVSTLEQQQQDLKSGTPQYIGGAAIANFQSQTASQFDFTGILTQDPLNPTNHNMGRSNFIITATADHAPIFYGSIVIYMWVASTTSRYTPANYLSDLVGGIGFQTTFFNVSTVPASAENQKSFSLQVTGDRTRTVWWKAYLTGLDTATLGIVQTL